MKETDFVLLQVCLEIEAESKPPGFAVEKAISFKRFELDR